MGDEKKQSERRKHSRFKPQETKLLVKSRFGEVIDISMGGIAFTYIDRGYSMKGIEQIGRIFGQDDLCIDDLPFKIISDCSICDGISVIRRCSAEFGKLTPKQISLLEHLVRANMGNDNGGNEFSA